MLSLCVIEETRCFCKFTKFSVSGKDGFFQGFSKFTKFSISGRDRFFSKRVPVTNSGKQTTPKVSDIKQSFYYAYDFCGSRIQIGHNEDGLPGLQDVWGHS